MRRSRDSLHTCKELYMDGFSMTRSLKDQGGKVLFFKKITTSPFWNLPNRRPKNPKQNQGNDYVTEEGVLGEIQWFLQNFFGTPRVAGGSECWYLEIICLYQRSAKVKVSWIMIFFWEFHERCGQRDGCSCTRSRYVFSSLSLFFLVGCLEVWTGNWSQFCMTHHIVLSDPATPPMCCACRTSQAMRQLLYAVVTYFMIHTYFLRGDVQWILLEEKRCIYIDH